MTEKNLVLSPELIARPDTYISPAQDNVIDLRINPALVPARASHLRQLIRGGVVPKNASTSNQPVSDEPMGRLARPANSMRKLREVVTAAEFGLNGVGTGYENTDSLDSGITDQDDTSRDPSTQKTILGATVNHRTAGSDNPKETSGYGKNKGVRGHLLSGMVRAKNYIELSAVPAVGKFFTKETPEGDQVLNKRRALIVGIGAVAVAATGYYLVSKYGMSHHSPTPKQPGNKRDAINNALPPVGVRKPPSSTLDTSVLHNSIAPHALPASPHGAEVMPQTIHITNGDTVWGQASSHLAMQGSGQPTQSQVFTETQRILDLNGLSWEQARHLTSGVSLKI